jgi:predicted Zn finger-like uncharacterized protein
LKFLCDNCKAKYQIADDKVAGKTVRMKCRKCGHQIEVRAAVTETSVSAAPPKPDAPRPRAGLATSLSAQKPRPQSQPQTGALAGAFQRTVEQAPTTQPFAGGDAGPIDVSVTDEWYVAINGVPVGPIRVSELRRKAAGGAVTEDSLCWQEGLEEWRPVRSIAELAAIVREAAQANRVSLVSPPPNEHRPSSPPRAPQRPAAPHAPAAAHAPTAPASPMAPASPFAPRVHEPAAARPAAVAPAPARSNVVPFHGRAATAEKLDDAPPVTAPLGGPSKQPAGVGALAMAPSPSMAPAVQPAPPPPAPIAVSDPFALPPPAPAAPAPSPLAPMAASASLAPPQTSHFSSQISVPPKKAGIPLWFWPILALFVGFGVAGGVFFFRQPTPQQIVVQVPAQPTSTATTPPPRDDTPLPASAEPTASAPPSATTAAPKVASAPRSTPAAAPDKPEKKGLDLSGLSAGPGGPNVSPHSGSGGSTGGGLDQAGVERVVAARRNGVKRTCWDSGANDKKSSANVTVTATVAPNGQVVGTSSSGDDPAVGKCIENQVRSWAFPAPGQTTTLNLPFHFVRSG